MAETEAEKAAREQAETAAKLAADKKAKEEADKASKGVKFEEWLAKQPEDVKAAYEEHTGGLKTALQSERDLNKEAKKAAARLKELEDAEAKRQEAAMTEADKSKKRIAELEKAAADAKLEVKTVRLKSAITNMAAQLGFHDPEDAYSLIDLATVTVTDDGKVEGAKEALGALAKAKPYMIKKVGPGPLGPTNPDGTQSARESEADKRKRLLG